MLLQGMQLTVWMRVKAITKLKLYHAKTALFTCRERIREDVSGSGGIRGSKSMHACLGGCTRGSACGSRPPTPYQPPVLPLPLALASRLTIMMLTPANMLSRQAPTA